MNQRRCPRHIILYQMSADSTKAPKQSTDYEFAQLIDQRIQDQQDVDFETAMNNWDSTRSFECCEPWFSLIRSGKKVVEGRLNGDRYKGLVVGEMLKLHLPGDEESFMMLKMVGLNKYATFREMLEAETIARVLPDDVTTSVDEGVAIYRQFYSEKLEKKKGVIAIHVELCKTYYFWSPSKW